MAHQLVCDSCGTTTPDIEEDRSKWIGVQLHKVSVPLAVIKGFDLCEDCGERVRFTLAHPHAV